MLGKPGTFSALTRQLFNFDDETGLWWAENWQLWTVYLNSSDFAGERELLWDKVALFWISYLK